MADERGVIAAIAIDQRGSLKKASAKPWWDFYGGKQSIEVVDLPA